MPIGIYKRPSTEDRFCLAGKQTFTGCIDWQKGTDRKGYGKMRVSGRGRMATHVAWFLKYGVWPTTLMCHTCDNPACVNVYHLFPGTIADNMADKVIKNRQAKGSVNGNSKLTERQVLHIRASKLSSKLLAVKYGVDKSLIWLVRVRKIRCHV